MNHPDVSVRCQRCGAQMDLADPVPEDPWPAQQFWECPKCNRHFWTTYPAAKPAKPAAKPAASTTPTTADAPAKPAVATAAAPDKPAEAATTPPPADTAAPNDPPAPSK